MMATKVQVVFDCADPARVAAFWEGAALRPRSAPPHAHVGRTGRRRRASPRRTGTTPAPSRTPDGEGPRLFFQKVPESKVAKNRMHLDLNVGGGSSVPIEERRERVNAEVARLKQLGATDERGAIEKQGEYWVRMNDPEGNEFCVQ